MSTTATIQARAAEALGWFETRRRGCTEDGEEYVTLRDERPEWVQELVRTAHGDILPDDWRYATIREALEMITDADADDRDALDDAAGDFADNVDVYTSDLLAWVSSGGGRVGYCDEAIDEYGFAENLWQILSRGQYVERLEVFELVLTALREGDQ